MNRDQLVAYADRRQSLVEKYREALSFAAETLRGIRKLPGRFGTERPNADLVLCGKCGDGPFTARELRVHIPRCKEKK